MLPKIYFCFPYRGVGGISLLFLRIAEELESKNLAETYLIDYSDGFMSKNMKSNASTLVEYSDEEDLVIPNEAVVVFQSMTPWSIFPRLEISNEAKVLFWNCYPFNLVPLLPGFRKIMQRNVSLSRFLFSSLLFHYRKTMVEFTNFLISGSSLVFQDRVNVEVTEEYLDIEIENPVFLAVPSKEVPQVVHKPEPDILKNGLRIIWIGRVVDFKYFTLLRFLQDIDDLQPDLNFPIKITLMGSGDYMDLLLRNASKLEALSIEYIKEIDPSNIDNFLMKEADMLIAMGTSALEGAKLGIPTLLLDIAHRSVPKGYKYTWFHEREGLVLADIFRESDVELGNESLEKLINELINDYPRLSVKALKHFQLNHSLEEVAQKMLDFSTKSKISWSELKNKGFVRRGFIYSTFSLMRKIYTSSRKWIK